MCKQKLGSQRCEKGFTLLDSLLQLMILVLFAHFFLLFFSWYAQKNNGMFNNDELHWELFAFQLQKENDRIEGKLPNSHAKDWKYTRKKEIPNF